MVAYYSLSVREKCLNTGFFRKCGPEKILYLDTFHAVYVAEEGTLS